MEHILMYYQHIILLGIFYHTVEMDFLDIRICRVTVGGVHMQRGDYK